MERFPEFVVEEKGYRISEQKGESGGSHEIN